MRKQTISFLLFLVIASVFLVSVASADGPRDRDDDGEDVTIAGIEAEGLGTVAQVLMIGTMLIIAWKPAFKWLRTHGPDLFGKEPQAFKKSLGVFNRRFMRVHNWIGFIAVLIGTVHGYVLEWHWTLWLAMACLWILVLSGSIMQWKWPPKEFRKGARLLHMQRAMSIVAIILLVIGHELVH